MTNASYDEYAHECLGHERKVGYDKVMHARRRRDSHAHMQVPTHIVKFQAKRPQRSDEQYGHCASR